MIASEDIIFDGFFLRFPLKGKLERAIENQHVTLGFRAGALQEFFGEEVEILVSEYGNNGRNEGFKVEAITCKSEALRKRFEAIKIPHITISLSGDAKPVETAGLHFKPCRKRVFAAVYGAFTFQGLICHQQD